MSDRSGHVFADTTSSCDVFRGPVDVGPARATGRLDLRYRRPGHYRPVGGWKAGVKPVGGALGALGGLCPGGIGAGGVDADDVGVGDVDAGGLGTAELDTAVLGTG